MQVNNHVLFFILNLNISSTQRFSWWFLSFFSKDYLNWNILNIDWIVKIQRDEIWHYITWREVKLHEKKDTKTNMKRIIDKNAQAVTFKLLINRVCVNQNDNLSIENVSFTREFIRQIVKKHDKRLERKRLKSTQIKIINIITIKQNQLVDKVIETSLDSVNFLNLKKSTSKNANSNSKKKKINQQKLDLLSIFQIESTTRDCSRRTSIFEVSAIDFVITKILKSQQITDTANFSFTSINSRVSKIIYLSIMSSEYNLDRWKTITDKTDRNDAHTVDEMNIVKWYMILENSLKSSFIWKIRKLKTTRTINAHVFNTVTKLAQAINVNVFNTMTKSTQAINVNIFNTMIKSTQATHVNVFNTVTKLAQAINVNAFNTVKKSAQTRNLNIFNNVFESQFFNIATNETLTLEISRSMRSK